MGPEVRVLAGPGEVARAAAGVFAEQGEEAVAQRGFFTTALSGGSTPLLLYSLLADDGELRARVPWERIHVFWGDERHVPPGHPESNYRSAREALLSRVPVPPEQVRRFRGEDPEPARAAEEYEEGLRDFFRVTGAEVPRFDLILLGMGADGHTASLFPGTRALGERKRLATANWVPRLGAQRLTLTLPVLNRARGVLFLVSGGGKARALQAVLEGKGGAEALPAGLVRPAEGRCLWLVDRAAARMLKTF